MKNICVFCLLLIGAFLASSCKKYKVIGEANYIDQQIYIPAAVEGNSVNGIYTINKLSVPGQVFRYKVDASNAKFNIPLSVYRSGVNTDGDISVEISFNNDTVNTMLLANKFPLNTELLPTNKFSIESPITIPSGASEKTFSIGVDVNYLLANSTKKFAVAIGIKSAQKASAKFSTVIILIDPTILIPTANFTFTRTGQTVSFANTSTNALSYIWNYGDGTANSTEKAAPHTFTVPGTYTITLISAGELGDINKATYSTSVVIP